jgi:hypothetical protein
VEVLGPVPVGPRDTVAVVEARLQQWVREHVSDGLSPPPGGYLQLAYDGAALDPQAPLLERALPSLARLEAADGPG